MKLHKVLLSVCSLFIAAATLAAAPRVIETTTIAHCADIDSTIELPALLIDKHTSFVDLNRASDLFKIQVIVPDELPLIVLATSAHCVPIFLGDGNSYMDYNGIPYVRVDSVASAIGCDYTPSKKNGGRIECKYFHTLGLTGTEIGERAPGFCLPDADGKIIRSRELLNTGKVVVAFIRSADWEPLSRDLLTRLNANRENFMELGAQAVVIQGYTPDIASGWRDSLKVEIPILSDNVSAVMRAFGVHQMAQLPHASIFVLDRKGIIRFKHVYGDEIAPPEMTPILDALRDVLE